MNTVWAFHTEQKVILKRVADENNDCLFVI
ncbi:hypothetical protein MTCD1_03269 [Colwellia marinimaniae]|uniref:Uncharacterized protein n=1 Tax=Colwellia marinimaniae TaxID=1513592 RepID=A0ABQ0N0W9_9GAMM|nr:hypothetical protein MTCD1_03269 [Colwellia marinimaniae]